MNVVYAYKRSCRQAASPVSSRWLPWSPSGSPCSPSSPRCRTEVWWRRSHLRSPGRERYLQMMSEVTRRCWCWWIKYTEKSEKRPRNQIHTLTEESINCRLIWKDATAVCSYLLMSYFGLNRFTGFDRLDLHRCSKRVFLVFFNQ